MWSSISPADIEALIGVSLFRRLSEIDAYAVNPSHVSNKSMMDSANHSVTAVFVDRLSLGNLRGVNRFISTPPTLRKNALNETP